MIQGTISTGSVIIDELLGGGLETDTITTVYGPAGSGKSNLALLTAVQVARSGRRVLYIDTEGSFSYARFVQLTSEEEARQLLSSFVFFHPTSFSEQKKVFAHFREIHFEDIGLIVVDSIAMLYRLEMGQTDDIADTNAQLSLQIGVLTEIARKYNIPVLITNQVYSSFDERDKISMVGGDILRYGSKCLLEVRPLHSRRKAIIIKHRSQPEGKFAIFEIREKGLFASQVPLEMEHS